MTGEVREEKPGRAGPDKESCCALFPNVLLTCAACLRLSNYQTASFRNFLFTPDSARSARVDSVQCRGSWPRRQLQFGPNYSTH